MKPVFLLLASLALTLPVFADTAPEVAAYALPADAVKVRFERLVSHTQIDPPAPVPPLVPFDLLNPNWFSGRIPLYGYFAAGAPHDMEHLLAEDFYSRIPWIGDGTGGGGFSLYLSRRELYKNGQLYGIQREWYANGQVGSETPYKYGVLDGTVKHWNPWGQLVGQYEMKAGNGKRRIYYDNGQLQAEDELKSNRLSGRTLQFYPNGRLKFIGRFKDGQPQGISYDFDSRGLLCDVICSSGPCVYFFLLPNNPSNNLNTPVTGLPVVDWRLNNIPVQEETYVAAAAKDPHLPPYYKDGSRYFAYFTAQVNAQRDKYQAQPHVLIPLLLDQKGNALAAPVSSPSKTPLTLKPPIVMPPAVIAATNEKAQKPLGAVSGPLLDGIQF